MKDRVIELKEDELAEHQIYSERVDRLKADPIGTLLGLIAAAEVILNRKVSVTFEIVNQGLLFKVKSRDGLTVQHNILISPTEFEHGDPTRAFLYGWDRAVESILDAFNTHNELS